MLAVEGNEPLCFCQLTLATSLQNFITESGCYRGFSQPLTLNFRTSNHQRFLKLFAGLLGLRSFELYHLLCIKKEGICGFKN